MKSKKKKKGKKEKSRGTRIDFKKGRGGDGNRGDEKRCFSEFRILRRWLGGESYFTNSCKIQRNLIGVRLLEYTSKVLGSKTKRLHQSDS